MDFNSFIRFLTFLRWSHLLGFVFAFISFFITGYYFMYMQETHRQTFWEFKNISNFHNGELELEPDRIYEITWSGSRPQPTELIIDGAPYYTLNYFQQRYGRIPKKIVGVHIDSYITNSVRFRVKESTQLGIVFTVDTDVSFYGDWGDFFDRWTDSWFDPVAIINWSVKDVTDEDDKGYIQFDKTFHIRK